MSENAGKLDQSLDDILKTRRSGGRRGRGPRRSGPGRPAPEAPVGGISKTTKQGKQNKTVPTGPAASGGSDNKILISNLPQDIEENQLKDYFVQSGVGKPKKILVQYGQNGRSLGSATVIFHKSEQASEAAKSMNNVRIDNRPIRVDLLISAANAPAPAAKPTLAERISQPKKDKPKPVTADKEKGAASRGRGARGRRGARGGARSTRGPKKTVEELDAEMEDYFPGEGGNADAMATNGGQANGAAGDAAMEDEML